MRRPRRANPAMTGVEHAAQTRARRPAWFRLRLPVRRRLVFVLSLAAYLGLVARVVVSTGKVPLSRDHLIPIVVGGILVASATSVGRLRRTVAALAVEWLPFVATLWLYDLARGHADGLLFDVHFLPQLRLDEAIGGGTAPTVWLQRHLWHGAHDVRWYDYATWATYLTYFVTPTLVLGILWWRSRRLFRELAAMVVLLSVAGVVTYVAFPAAPPWLAAHHGELPRVARLIGLVNRHVPVISLESAWEKGTQYSNPVAAVPSLHAGFTLLIVLFLTQRLRSRARHLLWLYPLAMAFALVYGAEHYVTDVLLGWLYAVAAYAAVTWVIRRRRPTGGPAGAAAYRSGVRSPAGSAVAAAPEASSSSTSTSE
jgi:membrane-associated phospholipid phosphatase